MLEDGETVVSGAHQRNNEGPDYVKLYKWLGEKWVMKKRFDGNSDNSMFGLTVTVASDGTRMVIGFPDDDNNESRSGAVYVYTTADALLIQRIDGGYGDNFGNHVSMTNNGFRFAVSAYKSYVRVFEFDEQSNVFKVIGENIYGEGGTFFGFSISLSGNGDRLAIGDPWSNNEGYQTGKMFLFAINQDS